MTIETRLYRVTEAAPLRLFGRRVAPGDLLRLTEPEARYERDCGLIVETTAEAEARPLDLTPAERAILPPLPALDAAEAGETALGVSQVGAATGTE